MLVKLSALMAKVPHYILALAMLITIWGPDVLQHITGTPLSAYGVYIADAIAFATAILGLAKQFSPGTPAAIASDKAIVAKAGTAAQAGFVRLQALLMLCALCLVILFLPAAACNTPAAQNAGQVALSTVPADAEFLMCEAAIVEADTAAKLPWEQAVTDSFANCTQDAIAIVNKLDGAVAQQVVSGKMTLAEGQAAMVAIHAKLHLPPPVTLTLHTLKSKVGAR